MFSARMRTLARAAVLAGVLVMGVPAAHATADVPSEPDGAKNLVAYGGCAGGLAVSVTFTQAWAALALCFKVVADEWDRTF